MEIHPIQLLQAIAQGHEPPYDTAFYPACELATHLICNVLPIKSIDVIVEGPPEYTTLSPLTVLYDFVSALQRTDAARVGITEPDDSLGVAQLAVHNFVTKVMPHCTYAFKPKLTRTAVTRLLPARDSWGKLIVKSTARLQSQASYTPFKEVPRS